MNYYLFLRFWVLYGFKQTQLYWILLYDKRFGIWPLIFNYPNYLSALSVKTDPNEKEYVLMQYFYNTLI